MISLTWLMMMSAALASTPMNTSCPAGNLLAGRPPIAWRDIRGTLARPTDGERAPEGAIWDAPLAVVLDTGAATLTWDLGAATPLAGAWVQADANDAYTLWGSLDGRAFRELARIEPVEGHGLRGRRLGLGGIPVRYLRFGEGEGDGFYSLSELQLFCQLPTPFPPQMPVGDARAATGPRTIFTYWNDQSSARWELILALLGLALLQWGWRLAERGRAEAHRRLRDGLLALLGLLAALTYINFGFFHFGNFIHAHEWTHYYLGSKYYAELSHDRLYECLSVADVEAGLRRRVERRPITNLRTNLLEKTDDILAHPERCTDHFSRARWQAFSADAAFFRARMGPRYWDAVQIDHGYNATPVWNAVGHALSSLGPASAGQLWTLAMLDPLYLAGALALIAWAFGWRALSTALLVFATNFPSRFYWTGGCFMRWDWLFFLVASVCLVKRSRPALAGAALACAAGLRIFPVFVFLGPALAWGWQCLRARRIDLRSSHARFFAGAAVAGALLFVASLPAVGGLAGYRAFAENTRKHQATGLVNDLGVRTVLAWRPSEVGRLLKDSRLPDPWGPWKAARLRAWRHSLPIYALLVVGFLVLMARAARHRPPWVMVALGVAAIPMAVELTSYYYMFILALALLAAEREEVGRWLLLLTAFTQFVAWAPLRGMARWDDEQYTLMAAATVLVFTAIVWRMGRREQGDVTSA